MNTDCTKCKKPMNPVPKSDHAWLNHGMIITGYRCDCGHWNDMKRRKGFAEWKKAQN